MSNIEYATFCITQSTDILANILLEKYKYMDIVKHFIIGLILVIQASCTSTRVYDISNNDMFLPYKCITTKHDAVILKDIYSCGVFHERKEGSWRLSYPTKSSREVLETDYAQYYDIINSDDSYCGERRHFQDYIELKKGTNINLKELKSFYSMSIGVPQVQFKGVIKLDGKVYEISYEGLQTLDNPNKKEINNYKDYIEVDVTEFLDNNYKSCVN